MLTVLPCRDSDAMADARRRELGIAPDLAARLGRTAVEAAAKGIYLGPRGEEIRFGGLVRQACERKVSIRPAQELPRCDRAPFARTRVQVANETTLGAARRLVEEGHRPLALNFASGVTPGGGFLAGARAQEETLCRSSALYATLFADPMYEAHARRPLPDSTDWAILSPDVPVFRRDDGEPLARPWILSILTCAAPLATLLGQPRSGDLLLARIHRVLRIARAYGYEALVLGAWGCGAFGNDSRRCARDFRDALRGPFAGAFAEVVFAIADWSPDRRSLGPFRDAFASAAEA
ncbi:MAG: hypothetical protein Fur0037_01480 [Planctomycetota bacterium]